MLLYAITIYIYTYVIYYLYIYICLIKINKKTEKNYMCLFFLLIKKKIVYINQITMLNYSSKQNKQILYK